MTRLCVVVRLRVTTRWRVTLRRVILRLPIRGQLVVLRHLIIRGRLVIRGQLVVLRQVVLRWVVLRRRRGRHLELSRCDGSLLLRNNGEGAWWRSIGNNCRHAEVAASVGLNGAAAAGCALTALRNHDGLVRHPVKTRYVHLGTGRTASGVDKYFWRSGVGWSDECHGERACQKQCRDHSRYVTHR